MITISWSHRDARHQRHLPDHQMGAAFRDEDATAAGGAMTAQLPSLTTTYKHAPVMPCLGLVTPHCWSRYPLGQPQ